jgi:hypothetical protein
MRRALRASGVVIALTATACGAGRGESRRESPVPSGATTAPATRPPQATDRAEPLHAARQPGGTAPDGRAGCVRDLPDDAAARWWDPFERGAASAGDFEIVALPDLDGDGVDDRAAFAEALGCAGMGGNCMHLVYLSRRGCAVYAGAFYGALHTLEVLPSSTLGVSDLLVLSQDGCAGRAGALLRLEWDGASYQQVEATPCGCPDDAPTERRSPHCPP